MSIALNDSRSIDPDDRLLTMEQVREIVPRHKTTIYRWIEQGLFPKNHQIGPASSMWLRSEVMQWLSDRVHKPPS